MDSGGIDEGLPVAFSSKCTSLLSSALWLIAILFCLTGIGILVFSNTWDGVIVTVIGILSLAAMTFGAPWLARLHFRKNPNKNVEIEWQFSPDGIRIIGPRSSTQAEWSVVFKVVATPDGLLFYFVPQLFNWVPRNGFATDAEFVSTVELSRKNCQRFVEVGKNPTVQRFRFGVRKLTVDHFLGVYLGGHFVTLDNVCKTSSATPRIAVVDTPDGSMVAPVYRCLDTSCGNWCDVRSRWVRRLHRANRSWHSCRDCTRDNHLKPPVCHITAKFGRLSSSARKCSKPIRFGTVTPTPSLVAGRLSGSLVARAARRLPRCRRRASNESS